MSHHSERLTRIMPLLQHLMSHLGVHATETGRRLGLTNTRIMALAALMHGEGCPMSDLAAALNLSPPLATRTADELVERGLVERASGPPDRRRVIVRATPVARKVFEDVHVEAAQLIDRVLAQMSPKEQDALLLGLEALLRAMHSPGMPLAKHKHP